MRIAGRILVTLVLTSALATTSTASVPDRMDIQGILTDTSGNPVSPGLKNFTFKIFDQQVGGTEIWPAGPGELQTLVTDVDGRWKAAVGTIVPLAAAIYQDTSRWLEITVDDGIKPPETLPRVQLNTVPYAFSAATLGGASLTNLRDQFVDVPGDTMTGLLVVNAPHKSLPGGSVHVSNVSDANTPSALGPNTIGVLADAKSDGADEKYALVGFAEGAAGNTVGVYGRGDGTGDFNVGVYGSVAASGTSNYAGYFWGGDLVVDNPATPGDSSVLLPANAISSPEILDEPGIATNTNSTSVNGLSTAAMVDLITVTITTPASGYIVVEGSFYGWISGSAVSDAAGHAQIDETEGGTLTPPYVRAWGEVNPATAGNRFYPVSVDRTYFKPAGTYTFRLEAKGAAVSGTGSANAGYPSIRATYFPQAYGSVTVVMTASDATDFDEVRSESVTPVAGASESTEGPQERMVSVDLRELELRALRARAEAERTHRELVEAQLRLGPAKGDR